MQVLKISHFWKMSTSISFLCFVIQKFRQRKIFNWFCHYLRYSLPTVLFFYPSCLEQLLSILFPLFPFVKEFMATLSFSLLCELCRLLPSFLHFLLFLNTFVIFYSLLFFMKTGNSDSFDTVIQVLRFFCHVINNPMITDSVTSQIKVLKIKKKRKKISILEIGNYFHKLNAK